MYDKQALKASWAILLKPTFKIFLAFRIKPVHITLIGSVLILSGCYAYLTGNDKVAFSLFFVGGLCDAIDGAYARSTHQVTQFGGFLDSMIDRYNEFCLVGCVLFSFRETTVLYYFSFALFLGISLTSYTRALFEKQGYKCPANPFEYLERGLLFLVFLALERLEIWLILIAVGTNLFVLHRIIRFHKLSVPDTP